MSDPAVIESCISGAALAPLTGEQRQKLAQLARRAFDRICRRSSADIGGSGRVCPRPSASIGGSDFDSWRHAQIRQCVERAGIRECRQEDYDVVKAHFLRLLGHAEMAERMQARADVEPRRQALGKLHRECREASDVIDRPLEYVAAISAARFKTRTIDDLSEKQLWSLVFDLRRNAQRRRNGGRTYPKRVA